VQQSGACQSAEQHEARDINSATALPAHELWGRVVTGTGARSVDDLRALPRAQLETKRALHALFERGVAERARLEAQRAQRQVRLECGWVVHRRERLSVCVAFVR
jgi:hypothetical protein